MKFLQTSPSTVSLLSSKKEDIEKCSGANIEICEDGLIVLSADKEEDVEMAANLLVNQGKVSLSASEGV